MLFIPSSWLWLEFANVLQDILISLGLLFPSHVIVRRSGVLYSFENLLVLLGDSLQLSLSTFLAQGVRVLDAVVRAINATVELKCRKMCT